MRLSDVVKYFLRRRQRIFIYKNSVKEFFVLIIFNISLHIVLIYIYENISKSKYLLTLPDPLNWLSAILILIVSYLFLRPHEHFKTQFKRNQTSWVWYVSWSLLIFPFLIPTDLLPYAYSLPLRLGLTLLIAALFLFLPEKPDDPYNFSYDALPEEKDELGFTHNIKGFMAAISDVKECVAVIPVFGDLGSGKSTYLRMVIERMDQNEFLYTYLSLTETNEAKDLSNLFAERWRKTLTGRYPSIAISTAIQMIKPLVRELNNNLIYSLIDIIVRINKPITTTKQKVKHHDQNENEISEDTSQLFGYIPNFQERSWIIVIDEMERSKLDEIYRMIEIIERLKTLGAHGLPIQIIFIICTSEASLKELLNAHPGEPSKQISDFFFTNPKSFTNIEFSPVPSWKRKIKYVQMNLITLRNSKNLIKYFDNYEIETKEMSEPLSALDVVPVSKEYPSLKEILDSVTLWMSEESPRVVLRILSDVSFAINKFQSTSYFDEKIPYGFAHMICMSYIKIKYPDIYQFLLKTIATVTLSTRDKEYADIFGNIGIDKKDIKIQTLQQWALQINPKLPSKYNWNRLQILLYLLEPRYKKYIEKDKKDLLEYSIESYVYPDAMKRYLYAAEDIGLSEDQEFVGLYNKYQITHKFSDTISTPETLYLFAKSSRRLNSTKYDYHLDIAQMVYEWMVTGKLKPDALKSTGDTIFHHLTYEFLFHLSLANTKAPESHSVKHAEMINRAGKLLTNFFASESIIVGSKMTLLDSIARDPRNNDTMFEIDRILELLDKAHVFSLKQAVKSTLNQYEDNYINNKKSIYAEENFFFVLYQYWNGDVDDIDNVNRIQKMAERDLDKYPEAVRQYWDLIPYKDDVKDVDELLSDFRLFNKGSISLYMPLQKLIEVTKKVNINDPDLAKKIKFWSTRTDAEINLLNIKFPLTPANTLMAVIKKRELDL